MTRGTAAAPRPSKATATVEHEEAPPEGSGGPSIILPPSAAAPILARAAVPSGHASDAFPTMRLHHLALATALLLAPTLAAQPAPDATPEAVVQSLVDAVSAHDVDAIAAHYADDARFYRHPDTPHWADLAKMREEFEMMFAGLPDVRVEVTERIVHGDYVVQQERYLREDTDQPEFTATLIYQVRAGRIQNLWVLHTD